MNSYMEAVDRWGSDVINSPQFDDETLSYCRETGDWMPVAFEWYRHAARLLYRFAQLGLPDDRGLVDLPHRHHMIMKGLLFRAAKYMTKGLKLIEKADNGDILVAIQRMSVESLVRCRWLIKKESPELFDRYIRAGLKDNIDLQRRIDEMCEEQGGTCVVNARLQANLDSMYAVSGITPEEVAESKNLPQFSQMLEVLDMKEKYLYYQSIPSSQVHGDWADLIGYHLEYDYDAERFSFKSTPNEPRAFVCFIGISFALKTICEYVKFAISPEMAKELSVIVETTEQEFEELYLNPVLAGEFAIPPEDDEELK